MKIKNRICIVLIVINALCACNAGSDGNGIVFDNLSVEKTTPITNEAGAPSCHVKLELACAPSGEASQHSDSCMRCYNGGSMFRSP